MMANINLNTMFLFYQAEAIIKIRADFAASVTANTITVQMPVPTYTARCFFLSFTYLLQHSPLCFVALTYK